MTPALARRLDGRPLLALLDVDGTLSPIAPRPAEAVVPDATRRVLKDLIALPDSHVAIISGRAAEDARRIVGVDGVWVIGNHGIEVAPPNRTPSVPESVAPFGERVGKASEQISAFARNLPGVIVENKRWTASVHYRVAAPSIVPELTVRVAEIAEAQGLKVTHAKKTLEVRPPITINKGTAAIELARSLDALGEGASLLVAGDDRTDEDMFRAVRPSQPAAVTVWVAHEIPEFETAAEFTVSSTDALRQLLESIVRRRRGGSMASAV